MTVSAAAPYVAYAGAGTSGPFAIPFRFLTDADLVVSKVDANGVETTLTGNTITGADADDGGELHTAIAVAAGETLRIYRDTTRAQTAQYVANGPFPAATHERALDKAMLVDQEQDRDLGRAVLAPLGEPGSLLPAVGDRAGFVMWDGLGNFAPAAGAVPSPVPVTAAAATVLMSASYGAMRVVMSTDGINDLWQQSRGAYGMGGINATPQLAAMFAVSPKGREGRARIDQYRMDTGLVLGSTLNGQVNFVGEGSGKGPGAVSNSNCTQLAANFVSGDVIYIGPTVFGSRLEHFQINSNVGARTGGSGIHINSSGQGSTNYGHLLNNIALNNQYNCISRIATGIGSMRDIYCQNWVNVAVYMNGDGAHEAAGGTIHGIFFGSGAAGTAQSACLDLRNGYLQVRNSLVIGAQVGCYLRPDVFPAGAPEYINNWTEENDLAGLYVAGGAVPVSMLAANWGEYSIATLGAAARPNYQGSIVLAAGSSPYLTTSQAIGNRMRNTAANPAGSSLAALTGTGLQVGLNNIEGLSGNQLKGITVGPQAEQVEVFGNMVRGAHSVRYSLTAEAMLSDFGSRLTAAEVNAIVCQDGSRVWCHDGLELSNPLVGGGGGCLAVRRGGIWRALASADAPTVVATDAAFTIANGVAVLRHTGTLAADRLVTLPAGPREFRITRTGAGAFNLNIGGLKNLVTNTWCVIRRDTGGLYLAEYGAL